jgi:hypothetical protein
VSLLHSLQFVRLEVSEQPLKIHIRKQQPPRPRVLMHFVDQQFRAPAETHSVAEETAGRREFDAHRQRSHQVRAGTINIPQNSHVRPAFGDWPALALFESLPRPLPLPLGSSRFGRHERLSRRSFMVGAAVFSFAVPSY